jgi:hypothetical protein
LGFAAGPVVIAVNFVGPVVIGAGWPVFSAGPAGD